MPKDKVEIQRVNKGLLQWYMLTCNGYTYEGSNPLECLLDYLDNSDKQYEKGLK